MINVESTLNTMKALKARGRPLGNLPIERVYGLLGGRTVNEWQLDLRPGDYVLSIFTGEYGDEDPIISYLQVIEDDYTLIEDIEPVIEEERDLMCCVRSVDAPEIPAFCTPIYTLHARIEERHVKALQAANWPDTIHGLLAALLGA